MTPHHGAIEPHDRAMEAHDGAIEPHDGATGREHAMIGPHDRATGHDHATTGTHHDPTGPPSGAAALGRAATAGQRTLACGGNFWYAGLQKETPVRHIPRTPTIALACGLAACVPARGAHAQGDPLGEPFPRRFELLDLFPPSGDGSLGVVLTGRAARDATGFDVANAGDINGDGIDDLIIGANQRRDYPPGGQGPGVAYVLFGRRGAPALPAMIDLATLDADEGFRISIGEPQAALGMSVSGAGDVNGDGLDDVVIGAGGSGYYGSNPDGAAFVIFGRGAGASPPIPAVLDVDTQDGANGFRLRAACCESLGSNVSGIGDVNGDGVDDLAVGAPTSMPRGVRFAGSTYVVYGRSLLEGETFESVVSVDALGAAGQGFRFDGQVQRSGIGGGAAPAGDLNGDGFDDVIFGAPGELRQQYCYTTYMCSTFGSGRAYVLFGRDGATAPFPPVLRPMDLDGVNGFRMQSGEFDARLGSALAGIGDVNGDDLDDVAVGSPGTSFDPFGFPSDDYGEIHVIFGRRGPSPFGASLDVDSVIGAGGFRIRGNSGNGGCGGRLAALGDLNNDGFDDFAFASAGTRFTIRGTVGVVYGRDAISDPFPADFGEFELDGALGFLLLGASDQSNAGRGLGGGGDHNADGVPDLLIGAPYADPTGRPVAGEVYVVYGRGACPADLDGDGVLTLLDFLAFQNLFDAGDPIADFDGDGELTLFDFLAFQNAFDAGCP
ncbi:MAG: GC-type dockerin domain-anchored protein [Phycisphaerales bacterium JB060]